MRAFRFSSCFVVATSVAASGCGANMEAETASVATDVSARGLSTTASVPEALDQSAAPVIYGADDRKEYFEITNPLESSALSESVVALIPKLVVGSMPGLFLAKTWGEVANLCPGEPFADQPSAAFCTGVLVDWDLILTAGHCARVLPIDQIAVVFNYYYRAPGQLAVGAGDVASVVAIVDEALDREGTVPRLDYAWFRLATPAGPPRRPAAVHVEPPALGLGEPVLSMGVGGGVPIKLDAGGKLRDLREAWGDYFVADTDTSKGSSGAGAFTSQLALLGVFARGAPDFVERGDGCRTTFHAAEELAMEQFTYAHQAVKGLCAKTPDASLCRPQCGVPCRAPDPPIVVEGGCALAREPRRGAGALVAAAPWLFFVAMLLGRRNGNSERRTRAARR